MRWLRHEPVQTGLPVFHPQKGQDPHTAGVSAGHGHADADLPSIQSATETANANIKKALLGYFTINAKTLENGIPEDTVSQILDVDGLSGRYTLRSYTYATYFDADGNLLEINTAGAAQVPEGYENAGRVVANSNSQEDSYFTDGGFEMVEGNPITTETGSPGADP